MEMLDLAVREIDERSRATRRSEQKRPRQERKGSERECARIQAYYEEKVGKTQKIDST
jgi:hypothetical protein